MQKYSYTAANLQKKSKQTNLLAFLCYVNIYLKTQMRGLRYCLVPGSNPCPVTAEVSSSPRQPL